MAEVAISFQAVYITPMTACDISRLIRSEAWRNVAVQAWIQIAEHLWSFKQMPSPLGLRRRFFQIPLIFRGNYFPDAT